MTRTCAFWNLCIPETVKVEIIYIKIYLYPKTHNSELRSNVCRVIPSYVISLYTNKLTFRARNNQKVRRSAHQNQHSNIAELASTTQPQ